MIRLLLAAWGHRGLLAIGSLAVTLLALWLRHRPAVKAHERAVEAARHRRLQAKRELQQAESSGTRAMIAESTKRADAALAEYDAARAELARATTEREAAEARLRALVSPAEPQQRETETER